MDRPILFSPPMVRALRDGRKTQTRRVGKMKPGVMMDDLEWSGPAGTIRTGTAKREHIKVPYAVGDRLWVRESVMPAADRAGNIFGASIYAADCANPRGFTPGMFMRRALSRIILTVTDVRVQRLQDISEGDAIAEGIGRIGADMPWAASLRSGPNFYTVDCGFGHLNAPTAVETYKMLWDSLNHKRGHGWQTNPWVVAVSFTVQRGNIDQVAP